MKIYINNMTKKQFSLKKLNEYLIHEYLDTIYYSSKGIYKMNSQSVIKLKPTESNTINGTIEINKKKYSMIIDTCSYDEEINNYQIPIDYICEKTIISIYKTQYKHLHLVIERLIDSNIETIYFRNTKETINTDEIKTFLNKVNYT